MAITRVDAPGDFVKDDKTNTSFILTRPACRMQIIYRLYSVFGTQSNLVSAATYQNQGGESILRPEVLIPALRKVIREHYSLSVFALERPYKESKDKLLVWEARLHGFDLNDVVSYIEREDADSDAGMRPLIEESHNEWLEPDNWPRWRIRVVNSRHVMFIYDHLVADGLSSYAFHRSLIRALNEGLLENEEQGSKVTIPELNPPPHWFEDFPRKPSILWLIINALALKLLRLFFSHFLLFSDAKYKDPHKYKEGLMMNRCKTLVYGLDLAAREQASLVQACKAQGVTYSSILHTLTMATLAADIYPNMRIGMSALPISFRKYAKPPQSVDVMVNSVGTMSKRFWSLASYRRAVKAEATLHKPVNFHDLPPVALDLDIAVSLSKKYSKDLHDGIASGSHFDGALGLQLTPEDMTGFFHGTFPNLRLFQQGVISLSNLGPFNQPEEASPNDRNSWVVTDIHFSAAAVSSCWGSGVPVFNIASLRSGACHMNIVIDEGVLPEDMMRIFLCRLKERLLLFGEIGGM